MIEKIINNNCVLAIIIRSDFNTEGITFFTPPEFPQQLGYMNRPKGYVINTHKHSPVEQTINQSFETLIVKSGRVKVFIHDECDELFGEIIIAKGDIMQLAGFGHGFEMLENSELIEIKQGPYNGDSHTLPLKVYSNADEYK